MSARAVVAGRRSRACRSRAAIAATAAALIVAACGGSSPTTPRDVPAPPAPIVANTPPVIESITASQSRVEVDTDVTLTATVRDAETPVAQLRYEWRADTGTITGEGATVRWRAPREIAAPADVVVRLTVTETLPTGGLQQSVNGTSPVIRVHDSPKELGALAMAFLGDFANSSVAASTCVRDFSDGCRGKADEKADIEANREHFTILNSSLRLRNVRVASNQLAADVSVSCSFTSRIIKCDPGSVGCAVGSVGTVAGDCVLTGVYEQNRWWLCTSSFSGSQVPNGFGSFLPARRDE
ncbi:MAG TPA: hypothetical protein VFJ02_01210 [Vicinamibacterales bacterium]|nr:hypothetical protein [Vicinamibacterales bacterium]